MIGRLIVVGALVFWQGGFVFYAGIVVPIGTEVLGSPLAQGMITRRVAWNLNLTGVIVLAMLVPEIMGNDPSAPRRWWRVGLWWFMVACQLALFAVYPRLDGLLDLTEPIVVDPGLFRLYHRTYLWLHTVQWAAAVVFGALSLYTWRARDRGVGSGAGMHNDARKRD